MNRQLQEMGLRLSDLREIKGFSQDEMAEKLEMSLEEYKSYENGLSDFSFSFMINVATILNIDVINLLSGNSPTLTDCAVMHKGNEFFIKKDGVYEYKHLAYTFKDKKGEPFFVEVLPGQEDKELHSHSGQEFNFVLAGVMQIKVGNLTYTLNKGDSVYFDSGLKHGIKVIGDKPVKFLAIVMK